MGRALDVGLNWAWAWRGEALLGEAMSRANCWRFCAEGIDLPINIRKRWELEESNCQSFPPRCVRSAMLSFNFEFLYFGVLAKKGLGRKG